MEMVELVEACREGRSGVVCECEGLLGLGSLTRCEWDGSLLWIRDRVSWMGERC